MCILEKSTKWDFKMCSVLARSGPVNAHFLQKFWLHLQLQVKGINTDSRQVGSACIGKTLKETRSKQILFFKSCWNNKYNKKAIIFVRAFCWGNLQKQSSCCEFWMVKKLQSSSGNSLDVIQKFQTKIWNGPPTQNFFLGGGHSDLLNMGKVETHKWKFFLRL